MPPDESRRVLVRVADETIGWLRHGRSLAEASVHSWHGSFVPTARLAAKKCALDCAPCRLIGRGSAFARTR
jgi:hypothetical protein